MAKITNSRGKASTKVEEIVENESTDNAVESPVNEVIFDGTEKEEKVAPAPPKSVRIKMAKDHKCTIGGVLYNLEKEKTYNVPENVKRILSSVGLLLPL